jgi:acetyl-CoA acyltransferase 1
MDTESLFNDDGTQVDVLSTPQPQHATLPSSIEVPQAMSPTTSMIVGNPSSPSHPLAFDNLPSSRHLERMKYSSPPPPSSSMTPPPSSQAPKRPVPDSPLAQATTPTPSVFSSPPPTLPNGVKREISSGVASTLPTAQQVAEASSTELREMLQGTVSEVIRLDIELREARMLAAHYKLQHNMLSIETEEAAKRMEVEHEMTRREVEVLQMAEQARQARQDLSSPVQSATSRYIAELKAYCEAIDSENTLLHRRLRKAKKIISQKDSEISTLMDDNRSFLKRIRENREHLARLKSPGGIYAAATPRSSSAFPVTPQQYRSTPKQTPRAMRQDHDSQDSFAALLLADRVLNQENNSAPSTPTTSRPPHRSNARHQRGVQSLSSLPSTPARSRPMTENGNLLPSVQFAPQSEPRYRNQMEYFTPTKERSRKSRDSTISAEDAEEIAAYNESADEDIPESQASQTAAEMLRIDPGESMEVVGSPAEPTLAAETSGLLQAKIFGSVTKSGVEKRKRVDDSAEFEAKRMRTTDGGIGLGIGGWA